MGGIVPLPFFPNWLSKIAYKLPFRYISDFPYRVYSGDISIIEGKSMLLGSFIWIVIIIFIGVILSRHALKKAVIQGG
jgi:ABC-2 type transport system permease protein